MDEIKLLKIMWLLLKILSFKNLRILWCFVFYDAINDILNTFSKKAKDSSELFKIMWLLFKNSLNGSFCMMSEWESSTRRNFLFL